MSSPTEPPTVQNPPPQSPPPPADGPAPRRSWRSRLRSRGVIIGAVIVAVLVAGGVAAALLVPDRHRGFDRIGPVGERGNWGAPWQGSGGPGEGPWGGGGPGWGPWGHGDRFSAPGGHGDERGPRGMRDAPVLTGTVASVADGTLVVNVDGSGQRSLRTDGDTRVRGGQNSGLGDLQSGERVVVQVQGTGASATARAVWTPQARVIGTVTALAGDRATLTSIDGLTVTADVAALSQKPVVGDVVVLTGVAADPSTIRADGIRVLPRAQ
ncbi:hypothetical protein [Pseudonocardia alaniniphila]|uniref:DUF5666 domain-containing protein n=1 Tax=Pseudonocardia alaniniphila TaxID=75291 RepID=A0ABS9T8X6_9PSEU|nr:hypothetical protein [Pseudonocardia alaniniphila]MCH6164999.1 hypothetical protein [Pseudonocardia alaniniphila]